jgi:mono/diheme cytochrome c family protein
VRCHSEDDPANPGRPVPGREFAGARNALTGRVASNITPDPETGAGTWTNEQLVRAIREGVGHDDRQLSPSMPWNVFSVLTDDDVQSLVVYLRTLPPIRNALPKNAETRAEEIRRDRLSLTPPVAPAANDGGRDPLRRGAYLVRVGLCANCHTPIDAHQQRMLSFRFAGGLSDAGVSGNLTPDPSGISYYDETMFMQVMRTGKVAGVRQLKPAMPWWYIGQLTDDDLRAVFTYLRTLPSVQHRVSTDHEETLCPICRQMHGYGDLNVASPLN